MKASETRMLLFQAAVLPIISYLWLSFGVYSDREFGTLYLFKKHRLSSRFFFYATVGESDTPTSSLPPEEQRAEIAYEEFVERGGGYHRAFSIFK